MKTCTKCGETKDYSGFSKHKNKKDGYTSNCKKCVTAAFKEWKKNNPEGTREAQLKHYYGINLAEYNSMLESQKGVCAICYKPEVGKALAVDHCHRTGQVRGLLCYMCNTSLGKMEDSPDRLRRAAAYLEEFLNDKS